MLPRTLGGVQWLQFTIRKFGWCFGALTAHTFFADSCDFLSHRRPPPAPTNDFWTFFWTKMALFVCFFDNFHSPGSWCYQSNWVRTVCISIQQSLVMKQGWFSGFWTSFVHLVLQFHQWVIRILIFFQSGFKLRGRLTKSCQGHIVRTSRQQISRYVSLTRLMQDFHTWLELW